ncbi:MAG TPA: hypothetical protein DEG71_05790 [Clostridiales bacterium]|nr:hypothetical protein [Clostridiales bacterium]
MKIIIRDLKEFESCIKSCRESNMFTFGVILETEDGKVIMKSTNGTLLRIFKSKYVEIAE